MLTDKKIVIAGAAGLLGSVLTKSLIEVGATVIATDIDIGAIQKRLSLSGVDFSSPNVVYASLDVTDENSVKNFFQKHDLLDGAVNCSYPRNKNYGKKFFDVTFESFNDNVSLHLGSAFLFSQQCAAYFLSNKRAFSLINISSVYGVVAPKFDIYEGTDMTMPVEYAAIKSAILQLNKYISSYVGDSNFRVNSVSPGGILDRQPEPFLEKYSKKTNGAGMLNVDDVLGGILFLLSDSSKYMTGQNLIIDDGFCDH